CHAHARPATQGLCRTLVRSGEIVKTFPSRAKCFLSWRDVEAAQGLLLPGRFGAPLLGRRRQKLAHDGMREAMKFTIAELAAVELAASRCKKTERSDRGSWWAAVRRCEVGDRQRKAFHPQPRVMLAPAPIRRGSEPSTSGGLCARAADGVSCHGLIATRGQMRYCEIPRRARSIAG